MSQTASAANTTSNWQSRLSMLERNRYMLDNEVGCDITFLVGENRRRVPAHKYVLISRSSVFHAMFCSPLSERGDEVAIKDVPEAAFTSLLRYMYCEETALIADTIMSVLYAAKKYDIGGLEDKIVDWLKENITVESVCGVLNEAISYGDELLREKCLTIVDSNTEWVLSSEGFKNLTKDALMIVLARDSLVVEKEEKVFVGVINWCRAECMRQGLPKHGPSFRRVLGEALYLVRFPLFNGTVFAREVHVANQGLLTSEECIQVFQKLVDYEAPCLRFSTKPRKKLEVLRCSLCWCRDVPAEKFFGSWQEEFTAFVTFTCDKPISIHGIGLFGSLPQGLLGTWKFKVAWEIKLGNLVLAKTMSDLHTFGDVTAYPLPLTESVPIPAGPRVSIRISMTGPPLHVGTTWRSVVTKNGVTFKFFKGADPDANRPKLTNEPITEFYFSSINET